MISEEDKVKWLKKALDYLSMFNIWDFYKDLGETLLKPLG